MISFSGIDISIIITFFALVVLVGFLAGSQFKTTDTYLLSGRKIGLFLFILTNVATWYGGILGVGEFTYRYGLLSWFTQGLPYYIFALLFAIFFSKKIQTASLFTIPEKFSESYSKKVGLAAAIIIFILVSPAPYLLMLGSLISLVFNIHIVFGLLIGTFVSIVYLFRGGYKSNIYTDAFQFFVMFIGFIIIISFSFSNLGSFSFLEQNLPEDH